MSSTQQVGLRTWYQALQSHAQSEWRHHIYTQVILQLWTLACFMQTLTSVRWWGICVRMADVWTLRAPTSASVTLDTPPTSPAPSVWVSVVVRGCEQEHRGYKGFGGYIRLFAILYNISITLQNLKVCCNVQEILPFQVMLDFQSVVVEHDPDESPDFGGMIWPNKNKQYL